MDGYIKNRKEAIAEVRKTIFYKYAVTFLILIFIPVWLLALVTNQPPEKWTHTEIRFSHLSQERIGLRRFQSDVLNTLDGRKFVIYVDAGAFSGSLTPGETYQLVFSETVAGGNIMEALYDENTVFQDLDTSILRWKKEQRESVVAIAVILAIEILALILIDRLWCKKEYSQIQKLKADIKRREERIKNK